MVGANGIGKTTLLKAIAGVEPASGGSINVDGPLGYMRQFVVQPDDETTIREFLLSFAPRQLAAAAAAVSGATERLESGDTGERAQIAYADALAAEGIFAKNGLEKVELVNFTEDKDINAALASGQIDGANIATHTAMAMAAAGLPIKIVMLEDISMSADAIIAGKDINSIADLKGKQVAFEQGTFFTRLIAPWPSMSTTAPRP
jgi:ABC-type nitrate/sulfonate/bicarbonate transport system substrate-binding protein